MTDNHQQDLDKATLDLRSPDFLDTKSWKIIGKIGVIGEIGAIGRQRLAKWPIKWKTNKRKSKFRQKQSSPNIDVSTFFVTDVFDSVLFLLGPLQATALAHSDCNVNIKYI